MERELAFGPDAVAHAEVALISEERLASCLKRVDADGDVWRCLRGDAGHANEPVQVRAVVGEAHLGDVVVVGHARVGAAIACDLTQNPLVAR